MEYYQRNHSQSKNSSEDYAFLDKEAKAETFNTFFANIGKNTYELTQNSLLSNDLTCPEPFPHDYDNSDDIFRPEPVDVETVMLTIKSLNETRSVGCDGISLNFISDSLCMIVFYLSLSIPPWQLVCFQKFGNMPWLFHYLKRVIRKM